MPSTAFLSCKIHLRSNNRSGSSNSFEVEHQVGQPAIFPLPRHRLGAEQQNSTQCSHQFAHLRTCMAKFSPSTVWALLECQMTSKHLSSQKCHLPLTEMSFVLTKVSFVLHFTPTIILLQATALSATDIGFRVNRNARQGIFPTTPLDWPSTTSSEPLHASK